MASKRRNMFYQNKKQETAETAVAGVKDKIKTNDEVAEEAMGDKGLWQFGIIVLMSATKFPGIWSLLSIVFLAPPIKFHCADSNTTCPDNCTRWVYDRSVFKETIVSQWDLVCSKRQLVNVGQLVFVAGVMIGNLFFSVYSDRIGRKIPMVVSGVLQGLAGIVAGLMPCYTGFVFFRFIQAFAVAGGICTTHVLCAEVLGARSRASVGVVTHVAVFIGTGFTAVVAHFTRHWRYFQIAISVPSLFVGAYWWLVPESPRWLLAVGRNEEALKILKSAASWNKNPIPEYLPEQIGSQTRIENKNKKATLLDLVKTPNVRKKNLNIWFSFGVVALNFYGIEQYLTEVGENMFINVAVSGVVMVPGVLLSMYTMNKFGRRVTLFASQFISAASCFIIIPIPEENERLRSAFAILGVTGAAVSFTTVFLFGSELFPTVARNMGMGVGCTCSRVGAMIAPFVVSMDIISKNVPPVIFASASLVASLMILLLPDTLGCELPETTEDAENFKKDYKALKFLRGKPAEKENV